MADNTVKFEPAPAGFVRRLFRMLPARWSWAVVFAWAGAVASIGTALWTSGDNAKTLAPIERAISGLRAEVVASDVEWKEMMIIADALADDSGHKISVYQAVETARVMRRKCRAYGPETGLDEATVLAVAQREADGFDPRSKSSSGALGLMQIVPSTYRKHLARLGAADKFTEELAYDPACNVEIAIEELIEQRRTYKAIEGTSWLLTLTAYRWGPGVADVLCGRAKKDSKVAVPVKEVLEYAADVQAKAARWRERLAKARAEERP